MLRLRIDQREFVQFISALLIIGLASFYYLKWSAAEKGTWFSDTIVKLIWWPTLVIPAKHLVLTSGFFPFPSLLGLVVLFLSPVATLIVLSSLLYAINQTFKILIGKKAIVVTLSLFLSSILIAGFVRMKDCEAGYVSGKTLELSAHRYLHSTGLLRLQFNDEGELDRFFARNGVINVVGSTPGHLYLVKVAVGSEFQTACRIAHYPRIRSVSPLSVDSLTGSSPIRDMAWPYVDPGFCRTNQIDQRYCRSNTN